MNKIICVCKECGEICTIESIYKFWNQEYGFEEQYSISECCGADFDEFMDEKEMEEMKCVNSYQV